MGRCLVIANQTLGGEHLERAVRERIARGDTDFFVVVPATEREHEIDSWVLGFPIEAGLSYVPVEVWEENERKRQAAHSEAQERAGERLEQMRVAIQAAGGTVEGTVGNADPVVAAQEVLDANDFDEVIVSTLPAGLSRWLKMDLPSRISRMVDVPVTTVEAEAVDVEI